LSHLTPKTQSFEFGGKTVTLETNRIARQASGAVLCTIDETVVLATVVAVKKARPDQPFFPLAVHYQEKYYAAGKIPGGYLKREGRPSEKETLTSRLIDRPIRPLFPKGFMNEVQVILNVVSANKEDDPDICAMLATSAALAISGVPFAGPIGAARVGYTDEEEYLLNPTYTQLKASRLNMVVAGTKDAVLMVESEADELSEDQMLGGVLFAHEEYQKAVAAISAFAADNGKPKWEFTPAAEKTDLIEQISSQYGTRIADAYQVSDKMERYGVLSVLRQEIVDALAGDSEGQPSVDDIKGVFAKIEKKLVRARIVKGESRIDGRDNKTVRPIEVEVGVLPSAHGSALFTRGETQALVAVTLGTMRDGKMEDMLHGTTTDNFMFHYNFPPFSVGEAGRVGGIGRREIGHGRLAKRGILSLVPNEESFPYSMRVVSEITESNGSSSMASVCGASLAMMDAGVPIKRPVAGIAMGLVKEGEDFAVLTDILGDEDHLGDMDFKVAGTDVGVTALQMDIKIEGITEQIMEIALEQAHAARTHILGEMALVISSSRTELSDNAPTMDTMKVDTDKIRDVIGKGGATIRSIVEETGAQVDIQDDGTVRLYAPTKESALAARNKILSIVTEPEPGSVYQGKVVRIADFGAFVQFLPGKDGLVHISQIADRRIAKVTDEINEGDTVIVKILDVDNRGRVKLSMREVTEEEKAVFADGESVNVEG